MKTLFLLKILSTVDMSVLAQTEVRSMEEGQAWLDSNNMSAKFGPPEAWTVTYEDKSEDETERLEIQDRKEAREFCLWVIDVIAAYNKKYTDDAQMGVIFSTPQFQGIILALLTGATKTARNLIAQVGPSLYPGPFVAKVLAAMDAQLEKENPPAPEEPEDEGGEGEGDEDGQDGDPENEPEV